LTSTELAPGSAAMGRCTCTMAPTASLSALGGLW
jgi:hypothetical protein